jgi:hypothetical protein
MSIIIAWVEKEHEGLLEEAQSIFILSTPNSPQIESGYAKHFQ